MSDRESFLAAIRAAPADDTLRLVYADWLDEQGNERDAKHAEMIRFEIDLHHTKHDHNHGRSQKRPGTGPQCPRCAKDRIDAQNFHAWAWDHLAPPTFIGHCTFRRGFADRVLCDPAQWIAAGETMRSWHPVERVLIGVHNHHTFPDLARLVGSLRDLRHVAFTGLDPLHWPSVVDLFNSAAPAPELEFFSEFQGGMAHKWFGTDAQSRRVVRSSPFFLLV